MLIYLFADCHLSPLETYNSLADRHLVHFFRSARMRKHLIKSGLVSEITKVRGFRSVCMHTRMLPEAVQIRFCGSICSQISRLDRGQSGTIFLS